MAHNIFQEMFYSNRIPAWHGLGFVSEVPMSAREALQTHFDGGYSVDLRPAHVELNGELVETGHYGIVRGAFKDLKEEVLWYATDRFRPLQIADVCDTFDHKVVEPVETLGVLGNGEKMFLTWKMPSATIGKSDTVDFYGIITGGFDGRNGWKLLTAAQRVVCANTLAMALNWSKKNTSDGKGLIWTGKAISDTLLYELGEWMGHVQLNAIREVNLIENFFANLAANPINDATAQEVIWQAYPDTDDISGKYPKSLREAKAEKIAKINEKQGEVRDGIFGLWQGAGTAITPDAWGLLNATTEYFQHYMPSKKPVANSVVFGNRQAASMQMVQTLDQWFS